MSSTQASDVMRILAIFPGLNPKYDDLAQAIHELGNMGNHVLVLAAKTSALKSKERADLFEHVGNVTYYRPFLSAEEMAVHGLELSKDLLEQITLFAPNVIFISSFRTLSLARATQNAGFQAPILMRVEHLDPIHAIYGGRRKYLGIPWLGRKMGLVKWKLLSKHLSGVITTNPADLYESRDYPVSGNRVFFAPHCNQLPNLIANPPSRVKNLMTYVGSLIRDKNCSKWNESVGFIFDRTPVERFLVIGDGPFKGVVDSLQKKYGSRIEHITSLPRVEALEVLRSSYLGYTEAKYGWGFIGDCWATGTPLLAPNSTYGLVRNIDSLAPQNIDEMIVDINKLYREEGFHALLSQNGIKRYQHWHTADVVAQHYVAAIRTLISYSKINQ